MAASVVIGVALATGLALGSGRSPVHVGPTVVSASDQVAIYTAVLVNFAGRPHGMIEPRAIQVSRAIHDTCMPRPAGAREAQPPAPVTHDPSIPPPPKNLPRPCGHAKVGRLEPSIEAALREALARQGTDADFREDGEFSLHQIVTEATGTPAADADDGHNYVKFHFKRVGGVWQVQSTTLESIVE